MDTTTSQPASEGRRVLELAERFGPAIATVTDWDAASPCDGWTAHDVLDHVVDTQRDFLAERGADLGPRPGGRGTELWRQRLAALRPVLTDETLLATEYDSYFGPTTVGATLRGFHAMDLVVHRWDVVRSQARDDVWADDELDLVEERLEALGETIRMEGLCAAPIDVPEDAPRQARLLGRLGRRP